MFSFQSTNFVDFRLYLIFSNKMNRSFQKNHRKSPSPYLTNVEQTVTCVTSTSNLQEQFVTYSSVNTVYEILTSECSQFLLYVIPQRSYVSSLKLILAIFYTFCKTITIFSFFKNGFMQILLKVSLKSVFKSKKKWLIIFQTKKLHHRLEFIDWINCFFVFKKRLLYLVITIAGINLSIIYIRSLPCPPPSAVLPTTHCFKSSTWY